MNGQENQPSEWGGKGRGRNIMGLDGEVDFLFNTKKAERLQSFVILSLIIVPIINFILLNIPSTDK